MEIEIRLCKKCHEKGVYSIPISEINKETNIIEYKCFMHPENSEEKTDFIKRILNKDWIEKLKSVENMKKNIDTVLGAKHVK